ncbi:extracellular solute-binding protein [Paenibacillus sp. FSL H8-0034]|uniref:extracellular solute-binding protein n=1 Tax=Paenibacillus sp. FSL H8-0034 TaxID=2954671 RepID=UPI0030F724DA
MTKNKRMTVILASALSLTTALAGCSTDAGSTGSGGTAAPDKEAKPTALNIMLELTLADPPGEDNPVKLEIEKRTNTKLNFSWVSSNNYGDKQNVTLASGDIPEMMLVLDPYHPQVLSMAKQGAFWDLTAQVKNYPNLSKFPEETWSGIAIDGKYYGIPRSRALIGGENIPLIRKDWLDQLGLKVPVTMDDMYNVMKAFTDKDPDGNGKKDTIGFTGFVAAEGMGQFDWVENTFNGSNGRWKAKDGQLLDTYTGKETRDALVWLNKAYAEGIISPDFPTLKNSQVRENITTNKAGMFADAMNPSWLLTGQMRKANPKADVMPLTYLEGPNGKYAPKNIGSYGMFVIPKSVPEAKVKQILQFMDYGASEEGWVLANYGLKDIHYTEKDGLKTTNEQAIKDKVNAYGWIFANLDKYQRGYQSGIPADFMDRNRTIIDERAKVAIPNPAIGLISDTATKVGKEYDKKIQDMKTKVIMGREPITAWDDFIAKLKTEPDYQKIVKEINEEYAKRVKK